MFIRCGIEFDGSFISIKISSAYNNNLCSLPPPSTPLIAALALMAIANGSSTILNSNGDRGQPCRVALVRLKGGEITPFVITAALGFLYIVLIHLIKVVPNPKCDKAANKNSH